MRLFLYCWHLQAAVQWCMLCCTVGAAISYHYFLWVSVSDGAMVNCINEQFIMCGCSLSVACSMGSGYSCHIGVDVAESYLILRAVVLTYIYGVCFTTPARAAVVAPRQASGLSMLCPSWGAFLG